MFDIKSIEKTKCETEKKGRVIKKEMLRFPVLPTLLRKNIKVVHTYNKKVIMRYFNCFTYSYIAGL